MVHTVAHKTPSPQNRSLHPGNYPSFRQKAILVLHTLLACSLRPLGIFFEHRFAVLVKRYELCSPILVLLSALFAQKDGQIEQLADGIFDFRLETLLRVLGLGGRVVARRVCTRSLAVFHDDILRFIILKCSRCVAPGFCSAGPWNRHILGI